MTWRPCVGIYEESVESRITELRAACTLFSKYHINLTVRHVHHVRRFRHVRHVCLSVSQSCQSA